MISQILKVYIALTFLFMGSLYAEQKSVTMENLLDGIGLVQLGFLTNTEEFIKEGALEIKRSSEILTHSKHLGMPSYNEIQEIVYTKDNVHQLHLHADNLLLQYQDANITMALKEYDSIIMQCINCHNKLRDFKGKGNAFR